MTRIELLQMAKDLADGKSSRVMDHVEELARELLQMEAEVSLHLKPTISLQSAIIGDHQKQGLLPVPGLAEAGVYTLADVDLIEAHRGKPYPRLRETVERIDVLEEALARATMKLAEVAGYIGPFEPKSRHVYDGLSEAIAAARKALNHQFIEQQLVRNMKPDRSTPVKRRAEEAP